VIPIPFFVYPLEVRRIIYTTAIGSIHMQLRKIVKNCGSDEAASKLSLFGLAKDRKMPFAIKFGERFRNAVS